MAGIINNVTYFTPYILIVPSDCEYITYKSDFCLIKILLGLYDIQDPGIKPSYGY